MTGKLNNAQNSTVIKFSKIDIGLHMQCQRKKCLMDIQSET